MKPHDRDLIAAICLICLLLTTPSCNTPGDAQINEKQRKEAGEGPQTKPHEADELRAEILAKDRRIAALEQSVAQLTDGNQEKHLLMADRASWYERLPSPDLLGTITAVGKRQCTVRITANPAGIDIQEAINLCPFSFALYNKDGYKAEVVAQRYEPSAKALLCRIVFRKNGVTVDVGDRAQTKP